MTPSPLNEPLEAFPIPPDAVLLEPDLDWESLAERDLAIAALRQAMAERLLNLPLELPPEAGREAESGPQLEGGGVLTLNRLLVQLICQPAASDQLAIPLAPWRQIATAPQLLLAALVDEENGVVWFPALLTASELLTAAERARPQSAELQAVEAGEGRADVLRLDLQALTSPGSLSGLERLFALVQLLDPAALPQLSLPAVEASSAAPAPVAVLGQQAVRVLDWLQGQLDPALAALGAILEPPALAAAFRSGSALEAPFPGSEQALAVLAIPLGIDAGRQLVSGEAAAGCIERFRLLLIPTGGKQPEQLLLRLVAELDGDLLPPGLVLSARRGEVSQSISASLSTRLDLRLPAADGLISLSLSYPGSEELELPPLQLGR